MTICHSCHSAEAFERMLVVAKYFQRVDIPGVLWMTEPAFLLFCCSGRDADGRGEQDGGRDKPGRDDQGKATIHGNCCEICGNLQERGLDAGIVA